MVTDSTTTSLEGGLNQAAMEKIRVRLNSHVATYLLRSGGRYIRYPEIHRVNTDMFSSDRVHLSYMGNNLFLYKLQQALQTFLIDSSVKVSPTLGENGPWLHYD